MDEPILVSVEQRPLSPAAYGAIGRLIRAMAELEDIITIQLFKVTGLSAPMGLILLGQLSIGGKITKLQLLAQQFEPEIGKNISFMRQDAIDKMLRARNTLCHGTYIGFDTETQSYLFSTTRTIAVGDDVNTAVLEVDSYADDNLQGMAEVAEKYVKDIEMYFDVHTLRERRRQQGLVQKLPLNKKPAARPGGAPKPPRPPQPSEA